MDSNMDTNKIQERRRMPVIYKEVPLLQLSTRKPEKKLINVSCGVFSGDTKMLEKLRTAELYGCVHMEDSTTGRPHAFIHWHTSYSSLHLTETSLHRNDIYHEVEIKFHISPILSVNVGHDRKHATYFLLITTITTFYRIPIQCSKTDRLGMHDALEAVLPQLDAKVIMDPMNCYNFSDDIARNVPYMTDSIHCAESSRTMFALAAANSLYVFCMRFGGQHPTLVLLLNYSPLSKKFSTLGHLFKAMCFGTLVHIGPIIYVVNCDSFLRVLTPSGKLLTRLCINNTNEQIAIEFHGCRLRASSSKLLLFVPFQTFNKYMVLQPKVTVYANADPSLIMDIVWNSTPSVHPIDIQLCDDIIWRLSLDHKGYVKTSAFNIITMLDIPVIEQSVRDYTEKQFLQRHQQNPECVLQNETFQEQCGDQYNTESGGLFTIETHVQGRTRLTVGVVRKTSVSFFRTAEKLEEAWHAPLEESSLPPYMKMLIDFTHALDEALTAEQKAELNSFFHLIKGAFKKMLDNLAILEATRNQTLNKMFLDIFSDCENADGLLDTIEILLSWMNPVDCCLPPSRIPDLDEGMCGALCINTGDELGVELVVTMAKQMLETRVALLRRLFLVQHLIGERCKKLSSKVFARVVSELLPSTESLLGSYHAMTWAAYTQLDLRSTKMSDYIPPNMRTSMSLLQAYAMSIPASLNDVPMEQGHSAGSSDPSGGRYTELSLLAKASILIKHLCPLDEDFRFGEWLSRNNLHIYIEDYARRLSGWCTVNQQSLNYIRAKSYLMVGETCKAVDLFSRALEGGIQRERYLRNIVLEGNEREHPPTRAMGGLPSKYYLHLFQLFQRYGAHDGILALAAAAIASTTQVSEKVMFQTIEFHSHVACGNYKDAVVALSSSSYDMAVQKDCLRQLILQLFSERQLGLLMSLCDGQQQELFANTIARIIRSSDAEDRIARAFLYAFYREHSLMRKAATMAYQQAMRYYGQCTNQTALQKCHSWLLTSFSSLTLVPEQAAAWIRDRSPRKIFSRRCDDRFAINVTKLRTQLLVASCELELSKNGDFQLMKTLEPSEIVELLVQRKMYNEAFRLARHCFRSMVPAIYEHLTRACLAAMAGSPTGDLHAPATDGTLETDRVRWLRDNCVSEIPMGANSVATAAWNYLRYLLKQEPAEHATEAHLAVLNSIIANGTLVPTWLKVWCLKHEAVAPRLVRAYLRYGRLAEATHCMVDLFQDGLANACGHAFPLTALEHLYYELEQSPTIYSEQRQQVEKCLDLMTQHVVAAE